ncbi:hypothetical protein TNCT_530611 [Trichonephila clavata]|uniref:Uncharacterized protein n=1 Tax=Trichonephila clavata TaxID=2740835 RepID=A0A8X6HZ37_TRICU|nr:hypothetical protein TNCT_530611 [Trichonephila clavata]
MRLPSLPQIASNNAWNLKYRITLFNPDAKHTKCRIRRVTRSNLCFQICRVRSKALVVIRESALDGGTTESIFSMVKTFTNQTTATVYASNCKSISTRDC